MPVRRGLLHFPGLTQARFGVKEMSIPPLALGLVICEKLLIEHRTLNLSYVGQFTRLTAGSFPAAIGPFSVCAVLTNYAGVANVELRLTRMDTDEEWVVHRTGLRFSTKLAEVLYHVRVPYITFPAPAVYQFTVLAGGEWVAQRRLKILQRE